MTVIKFEIFCFFNVYIALAVLDWFFNYAFAVSLCLFSRIPHILTCFVNWVLYYQFVTNYQTKAEKNRNIRWFEPIVWWHVCQTIMTVSQADSEPYWTRVIWSECATCEFCAICKTSEVVGINGITWYILHYWTAWTSQNMIAFSKWPNGGSLMGRLSM